MRADVLSGAALVAGKDLRIEWRSRVATAQTAPFAVCVLVLFGFALDPDSGILARATAGLYWVAVVLAALLAVTRSAGLESASGVADALRLSLLRPVSVFAGKAAALAVQLLGLQLLLGVGVILLYGAELDGPVLLAATVLSATAALAVVGTLYGALTSTLAARETLLPLLFLPVVAPILLAATRATEAGLDGTSSVGWGWCALLVGVTIVYLGAGAALFTTLVEEG